VIDLYAPPVPAFMLPLYGGSGRPNGYTWHLSVINAGRPRHPREDPSTATDLHNPLFNPVSWIGTDLGRSRFVIGDANGDIHRQFQFGLPDATPIAGDFNGDGVTEVGVFIDGHWFIDLNGNGIWDDGDLWARLGHEGDLPVTGDWDGDGKTDIGIFGPAWAGDPRAVAAEPGLPDIQNEPTGRFKNIPPNPDEATIGWRTLKRTSRGLLRADLIDHVFHYGTAGDQPVAGDWNGDDIATIGVFRDGTWYLDVDGNGRWSPSDVTVELGQAGDVPVVGDFNGDGIDELGVYRAGTWLLDTNGDRLLNAHDKVFELGGPDDKPVVGDFDGDGVDQIGVYQDNAPEPEQHTAR